MAWRNRSTGISINVDVDIDDLDTAQLLQGLIDDGALSEDEAAEILARHLDKEGERSRLNFKKMAGSEARQQADAVMTRVDAYELAIAEDDLINGRRSEAFIHLERALGRPWQGQLS